MQYFLSQINIDGFNERQLTEQDFYTVCAHEEIEVMELDVPRSFYYCLLGRKFIVLKKKLSRERKLFSGWHELAHHFLHGGKQPAAAFFFGLLETKNEVEANVFATVALCPITALYNFDYLDENPTRFFKKLYRERQRVWFFYGI